MEKVKIKLLNPKCKPIRSTEGAANYDVFANISWYGMVFNGEVEKIPLGFQVEIPRGWKMVIHPRSGLAANNGIIVLGGQIDSDYRGEVCALISSIRDNDLLDITPLMRIAQISLERVHDIDFEEVEELSQTNRGEGGFGSTGL